MGDTLTIRLSDELADALRREARQAGIPRGELVRQAIVEKLEKREALPVMSRYFGSMRGPADLSTNKAYRRAWNKKR
jgi:hypothetical protein